MTDQKIGKYEQKVDKNLIKSADPLNTIPCSSSSLNFNNQNTKTLLQEIYYEPLHTQNEL